MWSLISFTGCSRFALSSVCVGSLVVLVFLPFGGSFVGGFSPPIGILMLYVISDRGEAKWIKTTGDYFMGFKVPTSREEIGYILDKYSISHEILPNKLLLIKGEKEIRLLLEGRRIVS